MMVIVIMVGAHGCGVERMVVVVVVVLGVIMAMKVIMVLEVKGSLGL